MGCGGQTSGSDLDAKPPPSGRHDVAHGNSVCARITHHVLIVDAVKLLPQVLPPCVEDLSGPCFEARMRGNIACTVVDVPLL